METRMRIIIVATLVLILTWPFSSFAESGPFHCNGMIQHRPCGQPIATGPKRFNLAVDPNAGSVIVREPATPGAFLKILKQKFSQVSPTEGLWWGEMTGHGTAHLYLAFLRNGQIESKDSMGSLKLDKREGAVSFRFRSSTPKLPGWDWRVEGTAS
jgi:hypothetical protein